MRSRTSFAEALPGVSFIRWWKTDEIADAQTLAALSLLRLKHPESGRVALQFCPLTYSRPSALLPI